MADDCNELVCRSDTDVDGNWVRFHQSTCPRFEQFPNGREPIDGRPTHYWLAYHSDWSGWAVFDNETECLRYAVAGTMRAERFPYGVDPRDGL